MTPNEPIWGEWTSCPQDENREFRKTDSILMDDSLYHFSIQDRPKLHKATDLEAVNNKLDLIIKLLCQK